MPIGVLLIGAAGATASTLVGGAVAMAEGLVKEEYGYTSLPQFDPIGLIGTSEIIWSGWDQHSESAYDAIQRHGLINKDLQGAMRSRLHNVRILPGIFTSSDFLVDRENETATPFSNGEMISQVRGDIVDFRNRNGLDRCIVVNLSNPSNSESSLESTSGRIYAAAAISEGCDFIEFTPSHTITLELLNDATRKHVQVAGRDGSTGQTLLKVVLGHMFNARNMEITSWYSTNLLGNHDGYVLRDASYSKWKMEDKHDALSPYVTENTQHEVRIEYVKDRGDDKEAIDSIHLQGWLGSSHSLDLHWRGSDSFLAAPLILDLIRLVEIGPRMIGYCPGLQRQLGVFFKRPFEREQQSWSDRLAELYDFYCSAGRRSFAPET